MRPSLSCIYWYKRSGFFIIWFCFVLMSVTDWLYFCSVFVSVNRNASSTTLPITFLKYQTVITPLQDRSCWPICSWMILKLLRMETLALSSWRQLCTMRDAANAREVRRLSSTFDATNGGPKGPAPPNVLYRKKQLCKNDPKTGSCSSHRSVVFKLLPVQVCWGVPTNYEQCVQLTVHQYQTRYFQTKIQEVFW